MTYLVTLFADTVTYSCQARPVRADISLAHGDKAVGQGGARPAELRQGRHGAEKNLMSPLAGLFDRETIIPALFALGHIMSALTGLAGTKYVVS
jgi:hypothetical protein